LIYPNFREEDGELFLVVHEAGGMEVVYEEISRGTAWQLVMQLLKYLRG